jgi:L,D-transpeptidase ErfK/SrfK
MPLRSRFPVFVVALLFCARAAPAQPLLPEPADPRLAALPPIIGTLQNELIEDTEDTVLDVAYRNRLGFDRIARLNPDVNVWIPDLGSVIRLPTEHILPDPPWKGLVINVPEMQLYDFTQKGEEPEVFAIAIGDSIDPSLVGQFKIGAKRANPAWHVPKSILAERPELPPVVPPGPDNPLGPYWMTIGTTSYGIHGSNNEWSIGREATHGCIRLYNDQIERLFQRTKPGTPIRLLYETVKIGRRDRSIYVESHPDVYGRDPERETRVFEQLGAADLLPYVDVAAMRRAIAEARGIPVLVGTLSAPPIETLPGEAPIGEPFGRPLRVPAP